MTIFGTPYFDSIHSANRYYSGYGFCKKDVLRKINEGEIYIGEPELKQGEKLLIDKSEGRYKIEVKEGI